jgi:YVTN family beta-propeller protein
MTSDIAIDVQNVYKNFRIYHEKRNSIYDQVSSTFNRKKHFEDFPILQDISFQVKKGEMFGIIGLNGSGKTTLLRLLAGIMKPNSGKIQTRGKMVPLIALGTGFSPELTARDNIILNGMILGFTKKEIIGKIDAIIGFAELEKFVDTKLKNFSTGMHARLAFSIAMQVDPDILIVDEVLSVGDVPFQEKSFESFLSFKKRGKTIVFVTHNLIQVQRLCDNAIFLHKGKIQKSGSPTEVLNEFYLMVEGKQHAEKIISSNQIDNGSSKNMVTRNNSPTSIIVNANNERVYVANGGTDTVTVINANTNKILENIRVGSIPRDIAINNKTNKIYVANRDSNSLSVIDAASNKVIDTIMVGEKPRGIAINNKTNKIYVANRDSNSLSVIDIASNKVIDSIVTNDPQGLAVDENVNRIYVSNSLFNFISIIDGYENKVIAIIPIGNYPCGIAINNKTNKIYVANRDSNSLSVIDAASNKVIDTIMVGKQPFSSSVNPERNVVYVTNVGSNTLSKIDGNSNKVIAEIPVGQCPVGIAINLKSNIIYVPNQLDDNITVINGLSNEIITTVKIL